MGSSPTGSMGYSKRCERASLAPEQCCGQQSLRLPPQLRNSGKGGEGQRRVPREFRVAGAGPRSKKFVGRMARKNLHCLLFGILRHCAEQQPGKTRKPETNTAARQAGRRPHTPLEIFSSVACFGSSRRICSVRNSCKAARAPLAQWLERWSYEP